MEATIQQIKYLKKQNNFQGKRKRKMNYNKKY